MDTKEENRWRSGGIGGFSGRGGRTNVTGRGRGRGAKRNYSHKDGCDAFCKPCQICTETCASGIFLTCFHCAICKQCGDEMDPIKCPECKRVSKKIFYLSEE